MQEEVQEKDYEALLREALKKARELKKAGNKQVRELRRKRQKFKSFSRHKLARLCFYYVAGELQSAEKLLKELREMKEGIDGKSLAGRVALKILANVEQVSGKGES